MVRAIAAATVFVVVITSNVVAQEEMNCDVIAREAAVKQLTSLEQEHEITIAPQAYHPVVDEIVSELCTLFRQRAIEGRQVEAAAMEITKRYVSDGLAIGQAARVPSIVAAVVRGTSGLGRLDLRKYGVIKIDCPPPHTEGLITVNGASLAGCAKRILFMSGPADVSVAHKGRAICRDSVTIPSQREITCECKPTDNLASMSNLARLSCN